MYLAAQPILSSSHLTKENRADSGTPRINDCIPSPGAQQTGHPVHRIPYQVVDVHPVQETEVVLAGAGLVRSVLFSGDLMVTSNNIK